MSRAIFKMSALGLKIIAKNVQIVSGCIISGASVIAYIIGEGLTDAAAIRETNTPSEE